MSDQEQQQQGTPGCFLFSASLGYKGNERLREMGE